MVNGRAGGQNQSDSSPRALSPYTILSPTGSRSSLRKMCK